MHAEIYAGKGTGLHLDELGAVGSVFVQLVTEGDVAQKNHILVMDRYYNSVKPFHYLQHRLGCSAVGTALCNKKYYPKSLKKT